MYRESELPREYQDRVFNRAQPYKDPLSQINTLAFNPYVANPVTVRAFDGQEIKRTPEKVNTGYRASSPQPRQHQPALVFAKHHSQPEDGVYKKVWTQNQNLSGQERDRIIGGLREHFDRVLKGMVEQMNSQLMRRDDQSKRLESRLKDNQNQLISKQRQIARLRDHELELTNQNLTRMNSDKGEKVNTIKNKSIEQLQKNFEYITGRIRDIDSKIKLIVESYSANPKQTKALCRVEEKMTSLLQDFLKIETKKVYGLNLRIFQFLSSKDSLLVAVERQVQSTHQSSISQSGPGKASMTVYDQKLSAMRREVDGFHNTIQFLCDKQSRSQMQSGRLEKAERQLGRLQQKCRDLNEGMCQKWQTLEQCEKQYKMILSKINKVHSQASIKRTESQSFQRVVGHLKTMPLRVQAKYQSKPLKHKKISAPQTSTLYYSAQGPDSDYQQFRESDDQASHNKLSDKLLRLTDIIRSGRKRMPLRCVLDETGYLKERETGAYLFDRDGVLFELEEDEITDALRRNIILL